MKRRTQTSHFLFLCLTQVHNEFSSTSEFHKKVFTRVFIMAWKYFLYFLRLLMMSFCFQAVCTIETQYTRNQINFSSFSSRKNRWVKLDSFHDSMRSTDLLIGSMKNFPKSSIRTVLERFIASLPGNFCSVH